MSSLATTTRAIFSPKLNNFENSCLRCGQTVYPVDKVGPLKDFSFFHKGCFKCLECGTALSLRSYHNNQHSQEDKEVYCVSHVPKIGAGHLDEKAIGIRTALNAPRSSNPTISDQIRGVGRSHIDGEALAIKAHMNLNHSTTPSREHENHQNSSSSWNSSDYQYGRFDASALHIAHALRATELQRSYKKICMDRPLDSYLDRETQKLLESRHREEEDDLYRKFARMREEESERVSREIKEEWEDQLARITSHFEREMAGKKRKPDEMKRLTLRHQREKEDLEKSMTLKREKANETAQKKRQEYERAATAAMVEKQSREMMALINEKRRAFLAESGDLDEWEADPYPDQAPPPAPPGISKAEIYSDPIVFAEIDERAIHVAQEDQKTFTDLVRQLVGNYDSDIEKARAIFRWITVKNLNAMEFDETLKQDTPMGLLRGIKHGTESYHVLFKRLCSYVGLHCVVIKGHSKSAGYQPGVRFEDNRFRNSWNAVFVAGGWRFVQCNWGARHLVNAKAKPASSGPKSKGDSLRYEYDDHYFLTDPREFIHEFYPLQSEWQLLKRPISLQQFEELPFVRSLFFRYGLYFPDDQCKAVMRTDSTGATTIRIGIPSHMQSSLIFHYNLKFYENDLDTYDGVVLKRYVMQSVQGNTVAFRVHAPSPGALLLDIFANAVTPQEYLTGEPMKFKSVCKFKILCDSLQTVMVPLPDCASGEWGPVKATRLFGLIPLTAEDALIFASRDLQIQFRMTRPLTDFMATLHKNGSEERKLSKHVSHTVDDDVVTFFISFPEEGQYGMDIYTREALPGEPPPQSGAKREKHLLTHCCKYLINSSKRN